MFSAGSSSRGGVDFWDAEFRGWLHLLRRFAKWFSTLSIIAARRNEQSKMKQIEIYQLLSWVLAVGELIPGATLKNLLSHKWRGILVA